MKYYFHKTLINISFEEAIDKVTVELNKEGFGILSDIDVQSTLKEKLNVDFRKYRILGACNPPYAYKAMLADSFIGTMLPCNVVIEEKNDGKINVSAINPEASMMAVGNRELLHIGSDIKQILQRVINKL
jgi:uncharacterized protein (DUF302 family)